MKRSGPSSVPDSNRYVVKSDAPLSGVEPNRSTPVSVSSCRWQVDAGRRRDGVAIYHPMNRGFQNGNPCADCMGKAGSLAEMQPCPAAPAGDAIPLGLHPQVRFGGQPPKAALSPKMSARARPMGGLPPPALAGGE